MKKNVKNKKLIKKVINSITVESNFSMFEVIIIVLISICFGIIVGYILTYTNSSINYIRKDSNLSDIVTTYKEINENYYKKVDKSKLSDAAISAMMNSLGDSHTLYLDNKLNENFDETMNGQFVGIGITIKYEGEYNKVIKVNKGDPADKAGIKKDDLIIKIDGKDCKEIYGNEITKLIKGKVGSKVIITVKRNDKEKDITVIRGKVDIQSVEGKIYNEDNHKIGYIRVSVFASNTYEQFEKTLTMFEKKKIDSLIIDLRNNPGGFINSSRDILSLFFDKNVVLYQTQKLNNSKKKIYSKTSIKRDYPIVILGNKSSASSSEIVISCFKDNYKNSYFVGEKTYGKGSVQESQSLKSGNKIKYTVNKWYTSKGKSIEGDGINPDYIVPLDDSFYDNPSTENDAQLNKAKEIIKKNH